MRLLAELGTSLLSCAWPCSAGEGIDASAVDAGQCTNAAMERFEGVKTTIYEIIYTAASMVVAAN